MKISLHVIKTMLDKHEGDTALVADELGVSRRTVQRWANKLRKWEDNDAPLYDGEVRAPDKDRPSLRKEGQRQRFIITTAQNNTQVHGPFLQSLLLACRELDAELLVAKCTYNIEGFQNLDKEREGLWYDPALEPYFISGTHKIAPGLVFHDMNILPTAVRPLSGLATVTREDSAIIPHVKLAMESVPTTKGNPCKMLYTTGAVTLRNYIQQKAGQKANFHHVFGALLVDIADNGMWWVRQLVADEHGIFYDLDRKYDGVQTCSNHAQVKAVVLGDIHAPEYDTYAFAAALELVSCLEPRYVVMHDVMDFTVGSPHRTCGWDAAKDAAQARSISSDVQSMYSAVKSVLAVLEGTRSTIVVPASNHVHMFMRWLRDADFRKYPNDALLFLEWQRNIYDLIQLGGYDPERAFWEVLAQDMYSRFGAVVQSLQPDESFSIQGVELGMHGHLGPCGARGNCANLSRINTKATIGHTHSSRIVDGCYSAGTLSKLDMGYNKGPSNWSHSCVVQYNNGKRAIITIKDGSWRG